MPPTASARHASRRGHRPQRRGGEEAEGEGSSDHGHDVGGRIRTFLGEYRIITPALAALFGFQLTVAFQESYMRLPAVDRAVNFAGVACTAAAIVCLLVPASYHRFTKDLDETEGFLAFARRSVSLAFVFLPLAIALALYLQAVRTFQSRAVGAAVGAVATLAFAVAWWVLPRRRAAKAGLLAHHDGPRGGRRQRR